MRTKKTMMIAVITIITILNMMIITMMIIAVIDATLIMLSITLVKLHCNHTSWIIEALSLRHPRCRFFNLHCGFSAYLLTTIHLVLSQLISALASTTLFNNACSSSDIAIKTVSAAYRMLLKLTP